MALDTRKTQSLFESVQQVALSESAPATPEVEETTELSEETVNAVVEIAEAFLKDALGNQINESSSEEDIANELVSIVEDLNLVCDAVNTYFRLHEG